MKPRALFFGTPDFAVPCLEALLEIADVARVFCQPDRPSGRGMRLTAPPVKETALARGVEVEQPTKLKPPDFAAHLRSLEADFALVVAYGRILPRAVLDATRLGSVNVHGSLLPRWRGAAPIQWAIVHGDRTTGVTLMQMDEGMDTGPMLATRSTDIARDENAGDLAARLSALGASIVREEIPRFVRGELEPIPQDDTGATAARILQKEDGRIDWSKPARAVHDHARGMSPWPGAITSLAGSTIKIHRTQVIDEDADHGAAGAARVRDDLIEVVCGRGAIAIAELQAEGRKRMTARDYLRGHPLEAGARFGAHEESR
jgi:methionyl-tRNA formyltransferase